MLTALCTLNTFTCPYKSIDFDAVILTESMFIDIRTSVYPVIDCVSPEYAALSFCCLLNCTAHGIVIRLDASETNCETHCSLAGSVTITHDMWYNPHGTMNETSTESAIALVSFFGCPPSLSIPSTVRGTSPGNCSSDEPRGNH
jgi:hypothetical protein